MIKKSIALAGLLILSFSSHATIFSTDWKSAGDNLVTRDDSTGLDWLDLTETHWQSYNTVTERLQEGGDLYGWTYATGAQFDTLLTNFGGTAMPGCEGTSYCGLSTENNGLVGTVLGYIGDLSGDNTLISAGILAESYEKTNAEVLWQRVVHLVDSPLLLGPDTAATQDMVDNRPYGRAHPGIEYGDHGSLLVRTSPVPLPAAAWLFGSALIGLAGIKRKK